MYVTVEKRPVVNLDHEIEAIDKTGGVRRQVTYPWPFFVAMAATLLLFFSFQALFPTLPLYIVTIGGSPTDNGLAMWSFALAALLTRPLAGFLADRWGRKPVLVVGAVLFGGGPMLYALCSSVPWLLGARAAHGMGLALFTTAYPAFIADLLPPGRYGEGLGVANVAPSAAMVMAPLFGEWMMRLFDFGLSFLIFGAIGVSGMLVVLALPRRAHNGQNALSRLSSPGSGPPGGSGRRPRGVQQSGFRDAMRQPGVRAGALGMALLGVPFGVFIVFLPLLVDARRLGGTGLVFTAYALASSLTQPVAGRAADRWGARRTALVGLALVGLATAGLAVVAGRWALMGLAVLFGTGSGAAQAGLNAGVQGSVTTSLRGSAAAVQFTAFDLLVGLGSVGLGLLAEATDYCVMYAAVSGITLLGLVAGGLAVGGRGGRGWSGPEHGGSR